MGGIVMKKFIVSLLTVIILFSSVEMIVYADGKIPVAKVNGKEVFLQEDSYEYLKRRKNELEEGRRYFSREYTGAELKKKLQEELDQDIREQVDSAIEKEIVRQKLEEEKFKGKEYEFLENKIKDMVTDELVDEYIEKNEELLNEFSYKEWNSTAKEDMENIKKKLEDKDLLDRIIKLEKEDGGEKRPTLLDDFNRNQLAYELRKDYESVGMGGGSGSGTISPMMNIFYGDRFDGKLDELLTKELSKLKAGQVSNVFEVEDEGYYIVLLIDKKKLDRDDVAQYLKFRERKNFIGNILKEADIEYLPLDLKIEMDIEEKKPVKFANVNGKDLYLEIDDLDSIEKFGKDDREKYAEDVKKNIIRRELIYEEALKEGFGKDAKNPNEKWRAGSEYNSKLLKEMNITDEEIEDYIKENGGDVFKLSIGYIQYTNPNRYMFGEEDKLTDEEVDKKHRENANRLYEELKKDDRGYKIARIMTDAWNKSYDLSEEEKELLGKYNSFEDFYIGGQAMLLSTEINKLGEGSYFEDLYKNWEEIKELEPKTLRKPEKEIDELNDLVRYLSLVILDKTEDMEELKEDIKDQIKYKKLETIIEGLVEGAEIKYY